MITQFLRRFSLSCAALAILLCASCGRENSATNDVSPKDVLDDRIDAALNEELKIVWANAYTEKADSEEVEVEGAEFSVQFRVTAIIQELTDWNGKDLPPERTRLTVSLYTKNTIDYPDQAPSIIEGELTHSIALAWKNNRWVVTAHQVSFRDFPGLPDGNAPKLFMPFEEAFQDENRPSSLLLIDEEKLRNFVEELFADSRLVN